MKAIFFEEHGTIEVLKFADLPDPSPKPGEALIKVRSVALNHLDIWVRHGWRGLKLKFPHIGGSDIAGEVVSINSSAINISPGSRVIVNPGILTIEDEWVRKGEDSLSPGYKIIGEHCSGGLAQLVCVPAQNIFKLPDNISFDEGAAPLLVGTTCWRMLFKRASLNPGETVLIVGSGGGVNALSLLMVKAIGATAIVLAGSAHKEAKARELGADIVINYKDKPEWASEVLKVTKGRGADLVIDNVGALTINQSIAAAARGGRIVTVGNTSGPELKIDNRYIFTKQISLIGSTMGSREDFSSAMSFLWKNGINIPIDSVSPLADGIKMIKSLEDGEQFGKIVLNP